MLAVTVGGKTTTTTISNDPAFSAAVDATVHSYTGSAFLNRISAVFCDGNTGANLFANFNATSTTKYEIGSCSKTLVGHLLADSITRGEISSATLRVGDVVSALTGGIANATFTQLATHTSGLPSNATHNIDGTIAQLYASCSEDFNAANVGTYNYSNMGAALCAQALAIAAGFSGQYPILVSQRIFGPVGMPLSYIPAVTSNLLPGDGPGYTTTGAQANYQLGNYSMSPIGGIFSCGSDASHWLQAVMQGTAPGMDAVNLHVSGSNYNNGWFWGRWVMSDGSIRLEHNGGVNGYSTYWGMDYTHKKAIFLVSDTGGIANEITWAGQNLLVQYGGSA